MAGRKSRRKGAEAECEFFNELNKYLPEHLRIKRNLGQARDSGADGSLPFAEIEVKRHETLRLKPWLEQAKAAAGDERTAILAYRQNREPWHILVDMDVLELACFIRWRDKMQETEADIRQSLATLSRESWEK